MTPDIRHAAGSLLDFLRRSQAEHKIRICQPKAGGVVEALGFGARITQVQLVHLVTHDLGQMHGSRFFFAQ